jgi:hypothetical protein
MTAAVGTPKRLPDVERFNRRDFGHLEVQVTIDDPQASTKARSFPLQFEFLADTQTIEDVCDNQKDAVDAVGNVAAQPPLAPTLALTSSPAGTFPVSAHRACENRERRGEAMEAPERRRRPSRRRPPSTCFGG